MVPPPSNKNNHNIDGQRRPSWRRSLSSGPRTSRGHLPTTGNESEYFPLLDDRERVLSILDQALEVLEADQLFLSHERSPSTARRYYASWSPSSSTIQDKNDEDIRNGRKNSRSSSAPPKQQNFC
ncbi:hypothetical protein IV203_022609 [Nitzschia inconspicua]|uniref:Uncharacterized protein n=1 Tax=Nitzschia inconspicua TaxID=303405 RepID=A0A9K3KJJ3_9STRA|nr:hypothetical protein IV203_022609 [Nitzschia inconspicua]